MKKTAIRNSYIMGGLMILGAIAGLIESKFAGGFSENSGAVFTVLFAVLLIAVVQMYEDSFINE